MTFTDREIEQNELKSIYEDFRKIEIDDGVPDADEKRYQYIAEENGKIIGFVSGLTNHKWFYLTDLWVDELYRRKGLGSVLLKKIEDKARLSGMKYIYTWTAGKINPLFYEKHNYAKFAVFEDFYEIEGYNQTGYRKEL